MAARWQQSLVSAWTGRGWLARLLWPVSIVYATLVALRQSAYRWGWLATGDLAVPMVVVGNLVAGGAGKTPVVVAVVQHLQAMGLQPGVISRGYGRDETRSGPAPLQVMDDTLARDAGDEPLLIRRKTHAPVFVGRNRLEAARALLQQHPETRVIVSDDGLQHLAMPRDVRICVLDDRGLGNGWMLPAGPLREPAQTLQQMDLVLHSGAAPDLAAFPGYTAKRRLAPMAVNGQGQRRLLSDWLGKPVAALAGIARPQVFFDMLRAQGLTLASATAWPDHYDFDSWLRPADGRLDVICTEKDAVKLWPRYPDIWAVELVVELDPAFADHLGRLLEAKLSSGHGLQTT